MVRSEPPDISLERRPSGCDGAVIDRISEQAGIGEICKDAPPLGALVSAPPAPARAPAERWGLVRRVFDAAAFNAIVNHPDVFPFVANFGAENIDVTPLIDNPYNVLLMADDGGMLFMHCEPGIYEVHTAFLKEGASGSQRRNCCLAAYRWMFTHTDCMSLVTRMPASNPALRAYPMLGWTKEFERKAVWPTLTGELVDVAFAAIRYDDWVRKTPDLMESGRWFHERLNAEFQRHGVNEPDHPQEDCHDLHVGAAVEMIFGGQPEKAVILYNRWAQLAGYGLINMKSRSPLLFDIGNAIIQTAGDTLKVVRCQ